MEFTNPVWKTYKRLRRPVWVIQGVHVFTLSQSFSYIYVGGKIYVFTYIRCTTCIYKKICGPEQAHWEGVGRGLPGWRPEAHEFKQVESCFLSHNSSIHFCCTDSLLMTHRGGLSLSIFIWRIGGGGSFCTGAQRILLAAPPWYWVLDTDIQPFLFNVGCNRVCSFKLSAYSEISL